MTIKLIAAASLNNAIGLKGKLPWEPPKIDIEHFKATTSNHTVIMGSRTFLFDLQGKPLSNRNNIVLSRQDKLQYGSFQNVVSNPTEAIKLASSYATDIFIVGGAKVYQSFLPLIQELIITTIFKVVEQADTYFPYVNYAEFQVVEQDYYPECCIARYIRI